MSSNKNVEQTTREKIASTVKAGSFHCQNCEYEYDNEFCVMHSVQVAEIETLLSQARTEAKREARVNEVEMALALAGKEATKDGSLVPTGNLEGGDPDKVSAKILRQRLKSLKENQ